MRRAPTGPASNRSDIAQACGPPASWGRVRAPAARAATTQALSPPPRIASETSSRQIFKMAARTAASSASLGLPFVTRIELASTAGSYRHARQSIRHRRLHTPNGPSEPTPGGAKMSAPNRKGGESAKQTRHSVAGRPVARGDEGRIGDGRPEYSSGRGHSVRSRHHLFGFSGRCRSSAAALVHRNDDVRSHDGVLVGRIDAPQSHDRQDIRRALQRLRGVHSNTG